MLFSVTGDNLIDMRQVVKRTAPEYIGQGIELMRLFPSGHCPKCIDKRQIRKLGPDGAQVQLEWPFTQLRQYLVADKQHRRCG